MPEPVTILSGSEAAPAPVEATSQPVAEVPEVSLNPWYNSDGTLSSGWTERLPEDIKLSAKGLEKYKSLNDIVKGASELQKMMGSRVEVKPYNEMTPEQRQTIFRKMGAPEAPEAYGKPENVSEDAWQAVTDVALTNGILPEQLNQLVDALSGVTETNDLHSREALTEQVKATEQALRLEWGSMFESKAKVALEHIKSIGLNPNDPMFHTNPELLKMVYDSAKRKSDAPIGILDSKPMGTTDNNRLTKLRNKFVQGTLTPSEFTEYQSLARLA